MPQTKAERVSRLLALEAVRRQAVLDVPGDGAFDSIAEIARRLVGCQAAVIDIVDREGLFQLSHPGDHPADLGPAPVRFASLARDENAAIPPREAADPVKAKALGFGFYAGLPLRTADGHLLGTLAVLDQQPRTLGETELHSLKLLAGVVVDMIELRLAARARVAAVTGEGWSRE